MTEQHLHDAHLKKALEHAPDADVQVSPEVRNKVLGYAKNAAAKESTTPKQSWLAGVKNWLLKDHFANAQWAGLTGLTAMLLVAFLFWREHPEDIVGIGDTPANIPESAEIAQAPLEIAPDSAHHEAATATTIEQAEAPQNPAPAGVLVENKNISTAPPLTEETQANRPKSVVIGQSAQQNTELLKEKRLAEQTETDKLSRLDTATKQQSLPPAKKEITKDIALPEVVAPIEPAPTVAAAPAPTSAPTVSDATLEASPSQDKALERGVAQANSEGAAKGSISANSDANFGSANPDEKRRKLTPNHGLDAHFAKVLIAKGGKAMAESDTKAGNYRLLKVVIHAEADTNKADCVAPKSSVENIDERSGFPIKNIDVCVASVQLAKEVEIYNKTVLDWYFQYQGE